MGDSRWRCRGWWSRGGLCALGAGIEMYPCQPGIAYIALKNGACCPRPHPNINAGWPLDVVAHQLVIVIPYATDRNARPFGLLPDGIVLHQRVRNMIVQHNATTATFGALAIVDDCRPLNESPGVPPALVPALSLN